MDPFSKFINWYFRKDSLPYWCVFLIDCLICLLGGIFVCALFFRISRTATNIVPIVNTLLFYQLFNIIGFRVFHTYAGVIRYSSFHHCCRSALPHHLLTRSSPAHCSVTSAAYCFHLSRYHHLAVDFPHHDKRYL